MAPNLYIEIRKELDRIEEDALYSSKAHYNAGDFWRHVHLWIGIPNVLVAAVAGYSAFQQDFLVAGTLSVTAGALAALQTFLNPAERASLHHRSGSEYHALRNQARMFRNITLSSMQSDNEAHIRFEVLASIRDNLNAASPQIPRLAFQKARKGIEECEATYTA